MRLDLVLPAHDEERRIGPTLERYRAAFPDGSTRFVVALDGCRDGTAGVVGAHAADDHRVVLHEFPKLGKGGVLMEAFRRCDAEVVGFVDADGATPPADLRRLVDAVAGGRADLAIASRRHPAAVTPARRALARRLTSSGFAATTRTLFGLPYADTQCGAKVLARRVVDAALPLLSSRDFLIDVDLLVVADRLGFRTLELPAIWIDRSGSKLHAVADGKRMLASALRLWLHHRVLPLPTDDTRDVVGAA
jgi:glycosyltransferase involved in cell wall biosynthesis